MILKVSDGVVFTEVIDSNTKIESTVSDNQIEITVITDGRSTRWISELDDADELSEIIKKHLESHNHYSGYIYLKYISPISDVIKRIIESNTYYWSRNNNIRLDLDNDRLIRKLLLEVKASGDISKNIKYVHNYFKFYSNMLITDRERLNEIELIASDLFWPPYLLDKSVVKVFKKLKLNELVTISTMLSQEQNLSDFYKCQVILDILRDLRSLKSNKFSKYIMTNSEFMNTIRESVRNVLLNKGLQGFIESLSPILK